jgi:hypothetical protein
MSQPESSLESENPVDTWSIWLLPCDEDAGLLQGLIEELSAKWNMPSFYPHMTLHHGFSAPGLTSDQAGDWMLSRVSGMSPPVFENRELRFGETLTRSVVLALKPHPEAAGLARLAGEMLVRTGDWKFWPHVSLAYGFIPEKQQSDARSWLEANLPQEIRFDGLAIIECPRRVETAKDVMRWRMAWQSKWPNPSSHLEHPQ